MRKIIMGNAEKFGYFAWPTVCRLSNGDIAVVASGFRLLHICPFGQVAITYSCDEGKTWTKPVTVFDTPLDDRDAGIATFKDKVLLTTFNNTLGFQKQNLTYDRPTWYTPENLKLINDKLSSVTGVEEKESFASWLAISSDNGKTFDKRVKVPVSSPHGPITLKDGRLFYIGRIFGEADGSKRENEGIYYVYSDDAENFSQMKKLPLPSDAPDDYLFCEPYAVQLSCGRIVVAVRVQKQGLLTIYTAYSDDDGETFTELKPTGINGAPPHLLEAGDKLIMTYARREKPFGIRAAVSTDRGETFTETYVITDDGKNWDLGYPSTIKLKNGELLTAFYSRCFDGSENAGVEIITWKL